MYARVSTAIDLAAIGVAAYCLLKATSRLERDFVDPKSYTTSGVRYETTSLVWIRAVRKALPFVIPVEFVLSGQHVPQATYVVGLGLLAFGFLLRVAAILALGEFWSYHVELKPNHRVIRHGIYKYFWGHPAYVGNVYILGLCLMLGCPVSAALVSPVLLIFGLTRARQENMLLGGLSANASAPAQRKVAVAQPGLRLG